jgi:hypothetical protein
VRAGLHIPDKVQTLICALREHKTEVVKDVPLGYCQGRALKVRTYHSLDTTYQTKHVVQALTEALRPEILYLHDLRWDEGSFSALLTLLARERVWALNLGETTLTRDQWWRFADALKDSSVSYLYVPDQEAKLMRGGVSLKTTAMDNIRFNRKLHPRDNLGKSVVYRMWHDPKLPPGSSRRTDGDLVSQREALWATAETVEQLQQRHLHTAEYVTFKRAQLRDSVQGPANKVVLPPQGPADMAVHVDFLAETLRPHAERASQRVGPIFGCLMCDCEFGSAAALQSHEQSHLVQKHRCRLCGKEYAMRSSLTNHMRTHYPLKCSACNRKFCSKRALDKHALKCTLPALTTTSW